MANAQFAIGSFLGGEIATVAQGRFDKPDYRISLKVCLNSFPLEIGAWTRRPGTRFADTTRRGAAARVMRFDLSQGFPLLIILPGRRNTRRQRGRGCRGVRLRRPGRPRIFPFVRGYAAAGREG